MEDESNGSIPILQCALDLQALRFVDIRLTHHSYISLRMATKYMSTDHKILSKAYHENLI